MARKVTTTNAAFDLTATSRGIPEVISAWNGFQTEILAQVNDAVIIVDSDLRVTYLNPVAERQYAVASSEVIGRRLEELYQSRWLHPADEAAAFEALNTDGGWRGENIHVTRDGRVLQVESSVSRLRDGRGARIGLLAVIRDITARKQAEEALRQSEERFQFAQQVARIGTFDWDIIENKSYWSPELYALYGLPSDEFEGTYEAWLRHLAPEDAARAKEEIPHSLPFGRYNQDFRVVWPDGSVHWLHAWAKVLYDEAGRPARMIGINLDITERKQAEQALRENEQLLRYLVRHLPGGSLNVFDRDLRYLFAEGQGLAQAGLSPEQLVGKTLAEVFPAESVDHVTPYYRRAFAGEAFDFELEVAGRWYVIHVAPLRDARGNIHAVIALAQDHTERKRIAEKLEQSERHLAEAQLLTHLGNWNWEIVTNTVTWSDGLYRVFGTDPQGFPATYEGFLQFVHPEDRERVMAVIEGALHDLVPFNYYCQVIRSDGEVRIHYSQGKVETDDQGNPVRMFGTGQDVTERVEAEQQLKRMNENLRALSARVQAAREEESLRIARELHDDLGSALTGLKMDLAWLLRRLSPVPEEVREKFKAMADSIDETMGHIRQIAADLRPSVLDDLGLVAAIAWQAQEFQKRTEIECRLGALPEDLNPGPAAATAIFRILQEILTNVTRHAQATLVEIAFGARAGNLVLKVSDNGRGIKEHEKTGANSLGLQGMRERALVFGGRVEISGVEGEGTTVTVLIPLERGEGRKGH